MSRKKKHKMDMISRVLKPILAASTHALSVSGVITMVSPAIRGLDQAFHGDIKGAPSAIVYDFTGADINTGSKPDINKIFTVLLVEAAGVAQIAIGAYARKRIGRTH